MLLQHPSADMDASTHHNNSPMNICRQEARVAEGGILTVFNFWCVVAFCQDEKITSSTQMWYYCYYLMASLKVIQPTATHVTVVWSVCMYVCMLSVTLVHPAKSREWNEMPFDRDTHVVPNNNVFNIRRGPSPHRKVRFGSRNPSSHWS